MMLGFRDLPIRYKLYLMMLCTSAVALLAATVGFMYNQQQLQIKESREEAQISAKIIAYNVGASLVFQDKASANAILSSLRSNPDVLQAVLRDKAGEVFVTYLKSNAAINVEENASDKHINTIHAKEVVIIDHQEVGVLTLEISQVGMEQAIKEDTIIIMMMMIFSFFLSFLVALWIQNLISKPISKIANKMREVTNNKDYSLRVSWNSQDEVGLLAQRFNDMLEEIEHRDLLLKIHQDKLENTVEQRTQQIQQGMDQLKAAESSLNQIMQAMQQTGEAVLILNQDDGVEYFNPACLELSGYDAKVLESDPSLILTSDVIQNILPKVLLGDGWKEEILCRHKSGRKYPCLLTLSPIMDDRGKVGKIVAILRDLSDREVLEEQLRQSQKMESIGILVGGIAHDFNNLLAGIVGNLELAKLDINNPSALQVWLDKIESVSFRAAETIAKLLAFARKNIIRKEVLNLSSFLNESESLIRMGLTENITLRFGIEDVDLWIKADAHQLKQVLLNLNNNAMHALGSRLEKRHSLIEVNICKEIPNQNLRQRFPMLRKEYYAAVHVRDNGIGITAENINKIFEPFFTTKPEGEGTGLGLSMAYGMAQSHGGALYVNSTFGEGSEFVLLLPLTTPPKIEKKEREITLIDAPRGHGEWILIADDEILILEASKGILTSLGYHVIVAEDGAEAVCLFKQHQQDIRLIMFDLVMPKQGGADAAKMIRQMSPNMPIIFVSGYDLNSSLGDLQGLHDYAFITKPFRLVDIAFAVKKSLASTILSDK